jgi:hypothetical protein
MRIAYLTTDEVNGHLVEGLAAAYGLTLCPLAPKDPPPDEWFDAVLCDWDSWPVERRQELLAQLPAGRRPPVVAVHGYNLGDSQAKALRRHGIAIHRRVRPRVFRLLRRAIRIARAAQARGRKSQDRQVTGQPGGDS